MGAGRGGRQLPLTGTGRGGGHWEGPPTAARAAAGGNCVVWGEARGERAGRCRRGCPPREGASLGWEPRGRDGLWLWRVWEGSLPGRRQSSRVWRGRGAGGCRLSPWGRPACLRLGGLYWSVRAWPRGRSAPAQAARRLANGRWMGGHVGPAAEHVRGSGRGSARLCAKWRTDSSRGSCKTLSSTECKASFPSTHIHCMLGHKKVSRNFKGLCFCIISFSVSGNFL